MCLRSLAHGIIAQYVTRPVLFSSTRSYSRSHCNCALGAFTSAWWTGKREEKGYKTTLPPLRKSSQEMPDAGPHDRERRLHWGPRLAVTQAGLGARGPILALRRQLAGLAAVPADAGAAWLQHAKLCRAAGGGAGTALFWARHEDTRREAVLR